MKTPTEPPRISRVYYTDFRQDHSNRSLTPKRLIPTNCVRLQSARQIAEAVSTTDKRDLWFLSHGDETHALIQAVHAPSNHFRPGAYFVVRNPLGHIEFLSVEAHLGHRRVVAAKHFLPIEELVEVLNSDSRSDLIIGGSIDSTSRSLVLWRGDFSSLVVPLDDFAPTGNGTIPDFDRFSVSDYGHTLQFGDYEASVDAVLYENDPKYRRRIKGLRRTAKKSFGASLLRLRKQKRMRRSDFAPISAKTISRIERDETAKPHGQTLNRIAGRLGVSPDEIETF